MLRFDFDTVVDTVIVGLRHADWNCCNLLHSVDLAALYMVYQQRHIYDDSPTVLHYLRTYFCLLLHFHKIRLHNKLFSTFMGLWLIQINDW